jgi:acyl dehydratase
MERIRFEDVEALRKKVSPEFGPWSDEFEVTQAMIDQFAELTGDHQWIHTDVERARRESPFGTTIAHGFLTLSLLPRLSAGTRERASYEVVGQGNVVNYGSDKLRFLSPVPAGARVRSRSRLVEVEAIEKGTRAVNEIAVHVVGNEKPALLYQMIVLYQPKRGQ